MVIPAIRKQSSSEVVVHSSRKKKAATDEPFKVKKIIFIVFSLSLSHTYVKPLETK
jgi:hypothetical protein